MQLLAVLSLLTLFVVVPARGYQALMQHLASPLTWLLVNGIQDFAIFFGIFLLIAYVGYFWVRARNFIRSTLVITSVLLCFFGCVCAEYWIQRGLYPTGEELLAGLDDIRLVLLILHNWKTYSALVALGVATYFLVKVSKKFWKWEDLKQYPYFLSVPVISAIIGWGALFSYRDVQAQAGFFTDQLWFRAEYVSKLYEMLGLGSYHIERGAAQLGMKSPLVSQAEQGVNFKIQKETWEEQLLNPRAKLWYQMMLKLKPHYHDGLIFWHVILETTRADDYRYLETQQIAPFQTALFENVPLAETAKVEQAELLKNWNLVHVKRVFQAGARTTQSVSGQTCGLGTLPMGLSFSRDMGDLNAHCFLDVLKDAKIPSSFSYPGNLKFDRMYGYFNFHHLATFSPDLNYKHQQVRSVADLTLSDAQVIKIMLENFDPSQKTQYKLMLSMNHHYPYNLPNDYSETKKSEVAEILKNNQIETSEHLQWQMLGYQDTWLKELVAGIEKLGVADRSIIMITGDHSSNDPFWKFPKTKKPELMKRAEVPWVMLIPKSAHEFQSVPTNQLLEETQQQVLSLNDMPRLIQLSFFSLGKLDALPKEQKTFWMGGQSLSPWVSKTIGIASTSELFEYNQKGEIIDTGTKPEVALTQEKFILKNYELMPAAQFINAWLLSMQNKNVH